MTGNLHHKAQRIVSAILTRREKKEKPMSDVPFETGAGSRVNLARAAVLGLNVGLWLFLAALLDRFVA